MARVRLNKGKAKMERPLRPEQKRARERERSALCRQFPGTVVIGREGRVHYPNRYDWVDLGHRKVWKAVGKLYT